MEQAQSSWLPDGQRLHLHHGPIDLIVDAYGPDSMTGYAEAARRFETILNELVRELPALRRPVSDALSFEGPVARRMARATGAIRPTFVTPMASVAGAVADEILSVLVTGRGIEKAYVNNGGDIAFHLSKGQSLTIASSAGQVRVHADDAARGIATSGWRGRSHSLGIADSVTVAAPDAAMADVAATLIANAVNLPGHPAITREPARALSPDSDLGDRLVTTDVSPLPAADIDSALTRGLAYAHPLLEDGLICQAALTLQGQTRLVHAPHRNINRKLSHA